MFEFNIHTAVYLFYMYINPDFGLKRLTTKVICAFLMQKVM